MKLEHIQKAMSGRAAAFRSVSRLHPASKDDGLIFPPTFAGAVYSEGKRLIEKDSERIEVNCVVLDTVQSQANRMESALEGALRDERLELPIIEVDFSEANEKEFLTPVYGVNSLSVPHRLADAMLRDSELDDGTAFSKSECAKAWGKSTLQDVTAIYHYCPTALLFGMWGSPKRAGGLGERFARVIASEIVGMDCRKFGIKRGLRRDPSNIGSGFKLEGQPDEWEMKDGKPTDKTKPSAFGHGNIIYPKRGEEKENGGVTIEYAEQSTVISLPQLRRLRFPLDGKHSRELDQAGRVVLAALGLAAATLASEAGLDLRSGCLLWPKELPTWELLEQPGEEPSKFQLDGDAAIALLKEAVGVAEEAGLTWMGEPLSLKPQKKLVSLIRASQQHQATAGTDGE